MSLEQAIQENTAAVKALTEMLAVLRAPAAKCDGACKTEAAAPAETEAELEHRQQQERKAARQVESAAPVAEAPKKATKADVVAAVKAEAAAEVEARLKREAAQNLAAEAAAASSEPVAPKISLADLVVEGKKLLDAGKQADLKGVLAKVGGTKLSTLPEEKYAEVLPLLKALTANL